MKTNEQKLKVNRLIEYVKGLHNNLDGKALYNQYKDDIEHVTPQETFEIFHRLLEEGIKPNEILVFLGKVMNVFHRSLLNYKWEKPKHDNFLMELINENEGLVRKIDEIKMILKESSSLDVKKEKILPKIEELKQFNDHYLKKENILFPYMEKTKPEFQGVSIMWALHDVIREQVRKTIEILKDQNTTEKEFNEAIGKLYFGMIGLKTKEELILFPTASEVLSDEDWYHMHKQSLEYGFPFIKRPSSDLNQNELIESFKDGVMKTETGELSLQDVLLIFNSLPLDITFVDEFNKVRYFSKPKDRFFPRSPAVIGRDVKNCHPPDSVHIVEEIIEKFRANEKDNAKFWINIKNKMLYIQYFALRDKNGKYKGVLEVSQDITEIKELKGERRLLVWKETQ